MASASNAPTGASASSTRANAPAGVWAPRTTVWPPHNPFAQLVRPKVDREPFHAPTRSWIMHLMRQGIRELSGEALWVAKSLSRKEAVDSRAFVCKLKTRDHDCSDGPALPCFLAPSPSRGWLGEHSAAASTRRAPTSGAQAQTERPGSRFLGGSETNVAQVADGGDDLPTRDGDRLATSRV